MSGPSPANQEIQPLKEITKNMTHDLILCHEGHVHLDFVWLGE